MNRKIIILHGWAYSTEKWKPFLDILKLEKVETVVLKIPGLTAPLKKVWDINDYVVWLHEILQKEKGKVILLGHSNGGRITLAYTLKYPEKVQQLFLIDAAGIYHNEFPLRVKRYVFGKLAKVGKAITKSKQLRILLYKFVREHDYEKADPYVRETMRNLIQVDVTDDLKKIKIHATIIWGENDKVTPVSDGRTFEEGLRDSTLHVIDNARHSPMFTHPKEVAAIVVDNIQK